MSAIYVIKNKINDKVYVGKTLKTIEERFEKHLKNVKYYGKNTTIFLYKAMKKYGTENFFIELLEYIYDENIIDEREIFYIEKLNSIVPFGYNLTKGGNGGDTSNTIGYKLGMLNRRSYKGEGNPLYGKKGINNPKFGKKYGKYESISKACKKAWDEDDGTRKNNAARRIMGSNNPMHGKIPKNAIKIKYNGILYLSIAEAERANPGKTKDIKLYGERIFNE